MLPAVVKYSSLQASVAVAMQLVSLSFTPTTITLNHALAKTTKDNGPNGSIGFLNCGVDGSGWNPPPVHIDDVIVKSLSEAVQSPSSPFHACKSYVPLFNQYGDKYGIPAIFLASFAMQESSCNPNTVGGGGEQGLMQITKDKCDGAPGGDCKDPVNNCRSFPLFSYSMILFYARTLISVLVLNFLPIL